LVAGANFTLSGGGGIVAPDTLITGASKTGGKIDLNLSATKDLQTFDTGSTFADGNAGDVRMIAFKGTGVESGRVVTVITTNGPTISAIGGAAGTNGDILVIGGSTSKGAFALQLGAFNTGSLGTATGGNIELYNAVPKVTTGGVSIVNGAITGGSFDDGALVNGSLIMTNGLLATNAGGFFIAKSAGNVSLTNLNSVGDVTVHAGAPVISGTSAFAGLVVNDISSGGKIELKTTANNTGISLNGNINAQQDVLIEAHGGGGIFGLARTTTIFSNFGAGNVATFLLGVTVNKEGTKLYVPDFARDSTAEAGSHGFPNVAHHTGKVYVLDAATGASLGTITLGEGTHPQGTALSPDGSKLYVTYGRSNRFAIIDTATNSLIGSPITFGVSTEKAEAVAVAPNGNVYVLSNNGSSNAAQKITIFDANGVQIGVIDSASTGGVFNGTGNSQTGGIVINPVGTVMYVSSAGNKKVFAFDLQTNQVIGNPIDFSYYNAVAPQLTPYALAMDPNGTRVYVGIAGLYREFDGLGNLVKQEVRPGHIAVIDSTNFSSNFNKVLANVMLPTAVSQGGSFPQGLAVNATGTELLVQSTYLNGVSSMYTAPNQVLQFIETSTQSAQGNGPDGFGSSAFSSVVHLGEIPVMRTFSSNTQNLAVNPVGSKNPIPNNISVIQKGTVLGDNVTLKSGGGNIILNYAVRNGGTMTVNTTGGGAVLLSNLSDGANNVGASAAPGNFFEIGSTHGMTITGDIKSPRIILRSSSTADDIVLNANIGQTGAIIDIMANGNANIIQGAGTLITGTTARLFTGTGNIHHKWHRRRAHQQRRRIDS
jgi:DNA-binding beta-propeller fold protein YncE